MQLSAHLLAHKLPMSHLVLVYASYAAIPWFRILFKMGLEYQAYKWLGQKNDSSRILHFTDNVQVLGPWELGVQLYSSWYKYLIPDTTLLVQT